MTTPYVAAVPEMAPPFPVTPQSVPGLSSCLEERRLLADGIPIPVSSCDIDALRLVEHAVALGRSILLCPPDPLSPLVSLIPAAAHVASLISGYRDFGVTAGSRRRIAVVTGDYHLRGFYRGLAVRPRSGISGEPLRLVVPAGALGTGGTVHVLDESGRTWSTVFVRSVADLRLVDTVDLVVVDLPVVDPQRVAALTVPVVLVSRDPADPVTRQLAATMASFGWKAMRARGGDDGISTLRLANRAEEEVEILPVIELLVCENAELFWDDIGPLCRVARSGLGSELAREAFALFHDLLGLAMPPDEFDRVHGNSVDARVAALGRACGLLDRGELRDLYVPMVEAELAALSEAVRSASAKHQVLPRVLAEALDDRRDVLLVARTASLARAYQQYLVDAGLGRVRVSSLGALITVAPAEVAVLTGMAPTWGRWVYRSGIARTVRVLAYGRGEPSAGRFDEVEIVRRAVTEQREAEAALAGTDRRAWSWRTLTGEASDVPAPGSGSGSCPPAVRFAEAPPPPEAPPGLWEDGCWLSNLEPPAVRRTDRAGVDRLDRVVSGLRIDLTDGTWVVLAADVTVSRWRASAGRLEQVVAMELRAGDELVFLDEDAHKTLMTKVLEVAESVPALAVAGSWLAHWRSVLLAAYRDAGSYFRLAERLAEQGCQVQAQTVRLWVIGVTLGPDDPEDVHRLGLITSDPVLLGAHNEVSRAMRTLRGAHIRLGRRLAEMTRHIGPTVGAGCLLGDELVDELSGLTAADIESAVTVVAVRAITDTGDVPAVLTGTRNFREDIPA